MVFGWFGDIAMSPFNLFWWFFYTLGIHKASTQCSFTFSSSKINKTDLFCLLEHPAKWFALEEAGWTLAYPGWRAQHAPRKR